MCARCYFVPLCVFSCLFLRARVAVCVRRGRRTEGRAPSGGQLPAPPHSQHSSNTSTRAEHTQALEQHEEEGVRGTNGGNGGDSWSAGTPLRESARASGAVGAARFRERHWASRPTAATRHREHTQVATRVRGHLHRRGASVLRVCVSMCGACVAEATGCVSLSSPLLSSPVRGSGAAAGATATARAGLIPQLTHS